VPVTLHGHLCHRRSRIGGVGRYNGPHGARQGVYFGPPAPLQFGQKTHDFRAIWSVARFFADTALEARSARGRKKYESDHSYMSNGRDRRGASGSKRSFPQNRRIIHTRIAACSGCFGASGRAGTTERNFKRVLADLGICRFYRSLYIPYTVPLRSGKNYSADFEGRVRTAKMK
jgi:hypothetical protein